MDDDVDAAIDQLTEGELAELNEYVDPENVLLAAGERQESTTAKEATGVFDRSKLMEHLKKEAESSTVGQDWLEFDGTKKGRTFKTLPDKAELSRKSTPTAVDLSTGDAELDALLSQVNANEMDELADTLSIHGMTTQSSSHSRLVGDSDSAGIGRRPVQAAVYKKAETDGPPPQQTDVEESVRLLSTNDPSLSKLNLNNHDGVTSDHLSDICRSVLTNSHLTILELANTGFGDAHAKTLADSLDYNRCLRILNLESNRLTGVGVRHIIASLKDNTSLEQIRLNNQVSSIGNQAESELAEMLEQNRTIRKIGYSFKNAGARARIDRLLLRNNDLARQKRVSTEQVSYS